MATERSCIFVLPKLPALSASGRSQQPAGLEVLLRRRVDAALCKGIAPEDAPHAQKDPEKDAEVVDAPLGIFRAGRRIGAGVAGEIFLVKADEEDAEGFEVRLKDRPFQVLPVGGRKPPRPDLQQAASPF